ncbi:unnamed protein product [Ambrosiozyma monospora]|uniref:DNA-directed RNA polymerase n=1 Tax=Ambrosiozyma monospora TaxID=43982 RepID=A0A9W7DHW9_AMBMO|nr:unnamed protein product [Ambrosiozyma monospora]
MQPVKGRKRHGGIRVGEMERDALIGHGTSFLLQDRLLNCSDYTQTPICKTCGSFLSTQSSVPRFGQRVSIRCRRCAENYDSRVSNADEMDVWEDGQGNKFVGGGDTTTVAIPFVLKYLDSELSAMGIRMSYNVEPK